MAQILLEQSSIIISLIVVVCLIAALSPISSVALTLIFSLSLGLCDALGIKMEWVKIITEFSSAALFAVAFFMTKKRKVKFQFPLGWPLLAIGGLAVLSAVATKAQPFGLVLLLREVFKFYLLFLGVLNLNFSELTKVRLQYLIVALFLLQLPFSWYKFFTIGVEEKRWIGMAHQSAGQLSLLLPLFAISFLVPLAIRTRRYTYFALIVLFVIFAIIGEKRATVFLVPVWLIGGFIGYVFSQFLREKKPHESWVNSLLIVRQEIKTFVILVLISVFAFVGGSMSITSLNPDERREGTVSVTYLLDYTIEYLTRGYEDKMNKSKLGIDENTNIQLGRFKLMKEVAAVALTTDLRTFLFGFGPGKIRPSHLLGKDRRDILYALLKLRGSLTGIAQLVLETGAVAAALMVLWYIMVFQILLRALSFAESKDYVMVFGMLGANAVFLFDFLFYSPASWEYGVLTPAYFVLLAFVIQKASLRVPVVKN